MSERNDNEVVVAGSFKISDLWRKEDWLSIWIAFAITAVAAVGALTGAFDFSGAKFGFAGRKLNGADAETAFTPGSLRPASLGVADASVPITPATEFPALLERRILAALHGEEATNV